MVSPYRLLAVCCCYGHVHCHQLQLSTAYYAGVILLSEDLHRVAYNAAFEHFQIVPDGKDEIANWYALYRQVCSHRPVRCAQCGASCIVAHA